MAKATGSKAATETRKKPAAKAAATARKTAAKKPAAKKPAASKLVKKPAAKKPAARAKKTVKAKKPVTTAKSRGRKAAGAPATRAAKAAPAARARRAKSAVLEVSPAVIDTAAAAEVAARMVLDAHGPVAIAPSPLGNLFDPPPVVAVKRGSSALRHVKEMLHKPVARQLDGVFGPAPVSPETMRRFLRGEKNDTNQRLRGGTHVHVGQPTVPHRSVGNGGSRAGAGGGE